MKLQRQLFWEAYSIKMFFLFIKDAEHTRQKKDINKLIKLWEKESRSAIDWFKNNDIIVNPKKLQAKILSCDKKQNNFNLNYTYYIWRHTLMHSDILLGVKIDNKLNFENHISTLCTNASKQLNAMSRIWHYIGKTEKEIIINSFIYSNLTNCPLTWHFCSFNVPP